MSEFGEDAYFLSSAPRFWRWSDDGAAVTWSDHTTIAFRQEIVAVLERLAPTGFPSFDALVLLLAACRNAWRESSRELGIVAGFSASVRRDGEATDACAGTTRERTAVREIEPVLRRLDTIAALPDDVRTGTAAKAVLAEVVFEKAPRVVTGGDAPRVLAWLRDAPPRERADEAPCSAEGLRRFVAAINALAPGLADIDAERLRLRARTGLDRVPAPADVAIAGAEAARRLIESLRSDRDLGGLAALALDVMAALHVPRRLGEFEDLPCGGVADISCRGRLDRLLLSELALDDETLAARVALHQALYLRREQARRTPPCLRAVLVDCGIRLWGLPRVFGAAVAMALAATAEVGGEVRTFRAAGDEIVPVDMGTRAGIEALLAGLEPHPHPGAALRPFMELLAAESDARTEAILVTHAAVLADREFAPALERARRVCYVAAVAADGSFEFFAVGPAGRRTLTEARFPLERILAGDCRTGVLPAEAGLGFPVILSVEPFPLLLPCKSASMREACVSPKHGLFVVSDDGRLLHSRDLQHGGRQLTAHVPRGKRLGVFVDDFCDRVIAVRGRHVVTFELGTRSLSVQTLDLEPGRILGAWYGLGALYIVMEDRVEGILPPAARRLEPCRFAKDLYVWRGHNDFESRGGGDAWYVSHDGVRVVLNPGSALKSEASLPRVVPVVQDWFTRCFRVPMIATQRIAAIGMDQRGALCLWAGTHKGIRVPGGVRANVQRDSRVQPFHACGPVAFGHFELHVAVWPDGSKAFLDSRHLLHLVSADVSIPEITVVLTSPDGGKGPSGWASDGRTFGREFFLETPPSSSPAELAQLIERFAERLR